MARNLLRVNQFLEQNPAFTNGQIRWWIFNADKNGLSDALVRLPRRVLIDVDRFYKWIDRQQEHAA